MKKILVYSAVAVVLGLALTLVPLITITLAVRVENHFVMRGSVPEGLEQLEGPNHSTSDMKILAFSFVVASVAYLLFKRRTSHHDYRWGRPFPF